MRDPDKRLQFRRDVVRSLITAPIVIGLAFFLFYVDSSQKGKVFVDIGTSSIDIKVPSQGVHFIFDRGGDDASVEGVAVGPFLGLSDEISGKTAAVLDFPYISEKEYTIVLNYYENVRKPADDFIKDNLKHVFLVAKYSKFKSGMSGLKVRKGMKVLVKGRWLKLKAIMKDAKPVKSSDLPELKTLFVSEIRINGQLAFQGPS